MVQPQPRRYLLFHGHLKPALLREREDQYVKWEGTVWHSERTIR